MENNKSVFAVLNVINCNEHTEKKNGLTYLSWAWAWAEVKKNFPNAFYTIYEDERGCFYHTDGRTCWVKTGVTIEGIEHIEYLPVMDFKNASIPAERVTSFDANKAIQRSLTKACARHGLGLYIYAGEDLPEDAAAAEAARPKQPATFESAKKVTLNGQMVKEGKAKKIVEFLSNYNPDDFYTYNQGLKKVEEKYEITTDGYSQLDLAVRALISARNNAAKA